ncbi:thiol-disulfide oxidoreductase ResA [Halobacillus shinanisalinarum]|uniref:Thiol-disulfide oxidoreductase ResA n=1 Tax=Halobacillus shinanisalinarum TaxID=2932258 RepID=A0ABY4GZK0_9BACI|nr:thiol-disulfide oxidoreductase ResA [Halobacillus shinanisalinarum]UOQ93625.1 thiol-disulfide oxidoreductase ResA [Halobacillus shinanisalinarum]
MKEKTLKKKKKRLIFRTGMLAVMVGLVIFALVSSFNKEKAVVAEGEPAPDFQLEKFGSDGETIALSDLEGKGVMINFWATYCEPCKDEMPYMEKLYPEYKEKGVEILAVNLDSTNLVVEQFLDKYGITFPILQDENGQVMNRYNVGPIPSTFFISPEGKVVKHVVGPLTLDKLEGYLQQITPET